MIVTPDKIKCVCCKSELPIESFHKNKTKKYGRTNRCKTCQNQLIVEWRNNNRARYNESQRRGAERRKANGSCRNCSKPIAEFSQCFCEIHFLVNLGRSNLNDSRVSTAKALKEKLEEQNYTCPYTGEKLFLGVNAHLDHILPSSRFPDSRFDFNNLEWVSDKANLAKSNMTKDEFLSFCQKVVDYANPTESDARKVTPKRYDSR